MSESEAAPISPIRDASPSPHRVRNSPGITRSTEVNTESVGGDSDDGSSNNHEVERIRRSRATTKRDRSSFRTPRGRRLYRRVGLRRTLMPVPNKDTWDKESFLYTCVLVLLVGLVAYLSTVLDGWSPYLRVVFIVIFGAATGLACVGAMALISETPDPSTRHFAHIVSRMAFIVGSLAIEAAVFYLLGEVGFIAWLVVAAVTVLGMTYIWRKWSPESFAALVSSPGSVYSRVVDYFR
ncbi:hypothetical protein BDA96_02G048400 [Sorghum bicolor]|uniref:Uncharacterized protein n=1 Tax=Sorghum bicolor TaxID=4558 RepID=A0A921URN8_SORBI|nr:hypothetical protein BDA96_02G048400 [Sorghum bicolor]